MHTIFTCDFGWFFVYNVQAQPIWNVRFYFHLSNVERHQVFLQLYVFLYILSVHRDFKFQHTLASCFRKKNTFLCTVISFFYNNFTWIERIYIFIVGKIGTQFCNQIHSHDSFLFFCFYHYKLEHYGNFCFIHLKLNT